MTSPPPEFVSQAAKWTDQCENRDNGGSALEIWIFGSTLLRRSFVAWFSQLIRLPVRNPTCSDPTVFWNCLGLRHPGLAWPGRNLFLISSNVTYTRTHTTQYNTIQHNTYTPTPSTHPHNADKPHEPDPTFVEAGWNALRGPRWECMIRESRLLEPAAVYLFVRAVCAAPKVNPYLTSSWHIRSEKTAHIERVGWDEGWAHHPSIFR